MGLDQTDTIYFSGEDTKDRPYAKINSNFWEYRSNNTRINRWLTSRYVLQPDVSIHTVIQLAFIYDKDALLLRTALNDGYSRNVVPTSLCTRILSSAHCLVASSHLGGHRMFSFQRRKTFWYCLASKVHTVVSNCTGYPCKHNQCIQQKRLKVFSPEAVFNL